MTFSQRSYCGSEIELLDIAPVDMLNGMDKKFMSELPIPDHLKEQALDCVFHWVNEDGKTANLTAGITIQCTVSQLHHRLRNKK
jgi:hypothetical protein